jgi:hypothetical protein
VAQVSDEGGQLEPAKRLRGQSRLAFKKTAKIRCGGKPAALGNLREGLFGIYQEILTILQSDTGYLSGNRSPKMQMKQFVECGSGRVQGLTDLLHGLSG